MTKRKAPWTTKQEILMVLNSFLENDAMRSLGSKLINMKIQCDKERLRRLMHELRSKEEIPVTEELMQLNGFEKGSETPFPCSYYLDADCYIVFWRLGDFPTVEGYTFDEETSSKVVELRSVADLEDILELLGIEKRLKLY